jgi:pimeloyl-ACP methyl ester carboxylesterase
VDGFELAYDRTGDGPPAVLLHGWPGSRRDYRDVVARLAGDVDAVVPDLRHFWEHWSGPGWSPPDDELEALIDLYARPGAFASSIAWYRAGAGTMANALRERPPAPEDRLAVPTTVLWPTQEPALPRRLVGSPGAFFADADLQVLDGIGHFVPLQAPDAVAAAIRAATGISA